MILILSLLEMRKPTDVVLKRIAKSIPVYLLKKNIAWYYKDYKAMYGKKLHKDSLQHYDGEPEEEMTKAKDQRYWGLVIETPFLMYFLLLKYQIIGNLDGEVKGKEAPTKLSSLPSHPQQH